MKQQPQTHAPLIRKNHASHQHPHKGEPPAQTVRSPLLTNQQILNLQRSIGNQAVQRLLKDNTQKTSPVRVTHKGSVGLQRVLKVQVDDIEPQFKVPPLGKDHVVNSVNIITHNLDEYHKVAYVRKFDPHRLMGYIRRIQSAAVKLKDYYDPLDKDRKSFKVSERQAVLTFDKNIKELIRQCDAEVVALKPLILQIYPEALEQESKIGSGFTGSVYGVKGKSDMLYKPDQGLFRGNGAASKVGLGGLPASNRAVATSKLDKLLGTNVTGGAELAISIEGTRGHIMERAKGRELKDLDSSERQALFSKPTAKKGLYNLQTLDALTGEVDRNSGNIMVDESSGQITGIDNETAFSPEKSVQDIEDMVAKAESDAAQIPFMSSLFLNQDKFKDQLTQHKLTGGILNMGLPEYMDEGVALRIRDQLTETIVKQEVQDLLQPAELNILGLNFQRLQDYAKTLLEEHDRNPMSSKIIPTTQDDSGWNRVSTTSKRNYFYENG